jgi:hypothetical protein
LQSEIRDIILGAEITPPSQQRQQIAEIERQVGAPASQPTAVISLGQQPSTCSANVEFNHHLICH